jgi:hypothetical protein
MKTNKLEQLAKSLENLEHAIQSVYERFAAKEDISGDVLKRIDQYKDICAYQHVLCNDLKFDIEEENVEQVAQQVKVINGLSALLVEDVKQLLEGMKSESNSEKSTSFH